MRSTLRAIGGKLDLSPFRLCIALCPLVRDPAEISSHCGCKCMALIRGRRGFHSGAVCVYNRWRERAPIGEYSPRFEPSYLEVGSPASEGRGGGLGVEVRRGAAALALSLAEFNRMVSEHGPTLYRVAYRMVGDRHEAEDLVQEAFRSAWRSRRLFQPGSGERAWLASILRRRVADHWRRPRPPLVLAGQRNIEVGLPAEDPLRDDFTDEMQQALERLPPDLRETLLLVVVAELTHQEAADLLGIPLGTVLSRVSRARKQLRDYLHVTTSGGRKH